MNNRLDYLDSIRGFAALLVVFQHIFEVFIKYDEVQYAGLHYLFETINVGRLGVIIFFITSGFVIPWSFNATDPHAIKNFTIKRFFRLYPAYWFSILAATCIGIGVGVNVESVHQVLFNFTMLHKFFGVESVIGAYWTLHLELLFYITCVGLFYFSQLKNNKCLITFIVLLSCCAVAFAAMRYYYQIRLPIIMPLGLAAMFYGAVLRNYLIEKQTALRVPLILVTFFYFASLIVAQKLYYLDGWFSWFITQVLAFSLFYLFVTKFKLTSGFAVYMGRISYSLYLLHALVIGVVFYYFQGFAFTELGFYLVVTTIFISSILVADFSYRFIEKPGVGLAKKFTLRMQAIEV